MKKFLFPALFISCFLFFHRAMIACPHFAFNHRNEPELKPPINLPPFRNIKNTWKILWLLGSGCVRLQDISTYSYIDTGIDKTHQRSNKIIIAPSTFIISFKTKPQCTRAVRFIITSESTQNRQSCEVSLQADYLFNNV